MWNSVRLIITIDQTAVRIVSQKNHFEECQWNENDSIKILFFLQGKLCGEVSGNVVDIVEIQLKWSPRETTITIEIVDANK